MKIEVVHRLATLQDLNALSSLEERCFTSDRISRRQFRYLLSKGNAITLLALQHEKLVAYVTLLFSKATSMARLYSIAVGPEALRSGIGKALVLGAEAIAIERKVITLRLEIRLDNLPSQRLFESLAYRPFDRIHDYYEDHSEAIRYEKSLAPQFKSKVRSIPYYQQTLDFTCGPAALMMAMKAHHSDQVFSRSEEIRLWREATTIFMTSGHGGCSPYGLALAASQRGFRAEVYTNDQGVLFVNSVRSPDKKEVMRIVQEDMIKQMHARNIPIHFNTLRGPDLGDIFAAGGIPIMLISSYAIYGEKHPHWVAANGCDADFVYVNDPFVDIDAGESVIDSINMPIPLKTFNKMARYGRAGLTAEVIIYPQEN